MYVTNLFSVVTHNFFNNKISKINHKVISYDVALASMEEVEAAICHLKSSSYGIPANLCEAAGALHHLLQQIWDAECMPKEWKQSIICPIHKIGDRKDGNNYRWISLLNTAYKIMRSANINTGNIIYKEPCG